MTTEQDAASAAQSASEAATSAAQALAARQASQAIAALISGGAVLPAGAMQNDDSFSLMRDGLMLKGTMADLYAFLVPALTPLGTDLASAAVGKGAEMVGFSGSGAGAASRTVAARLRDQVNAADYWLPTDGADWTNALTKAQAALPNGGYVNLPAGVIEASVITLKRFIVLRGQGVFASELKQLPGVNADFIVSENFAVLTGTGLTVSGDAQVPSFFGLQDVRVNGNKANNTAGRGVAWYGAALVMAGVVLVYDCADDGIYTEYSITSGSTGWQGQEEGQFDTVIPRNNGGDGWTFRGPHNSRIGAVIAGFNGGWGFKNESGANYDGGIDYANYIHTYANGQSSAPAADTGCQLNEIGRFGAIITDGDNLDVPGSNIQIGSYRGYNIGGQRDGLTISGNANMIAAVHAVVWTSSVGRKAISITGARNKISALDLFSNNADNDGVSITGASNKLDAAYIQGFSAAGRIGLALASSKNRVVAEITGCNIAFNYTAGNNNTVELEINTSAGQVPVAGSTPGSSDRFDIRAGGTVPGGTAANVQSATVPMDITTIQNITIPHGLLYTPNRQDISLTLLDSSPTATNYEIAYMRVNSTDATNVVVGLKLAVAGSAGTLARIGVRAGR